MQYEYPGETECYIELERQLGIKIFAYIGQIKMETMKALGCWYPQFCVPIFSVEQRRKRESRRNLSMPSSIN